MEGPERLDVKPWRLPRRTWVVVGAAVVLVGVLALRLGGFAPSPRPVSAPSSSSRPSRTTWPEHGEIGAGTLYVTVDGAVHRIDVDSGRLTATGVRLDPIDTRLTPMLDGVLVWLASGGGKRLLGRETGGGEPVHGALRSGDAFLAGGDDSVWVATAANGSGGATTWRLVDRDGRASAEVKAQGAVASDGAGGLLAVLDAGFRRVYPPPPGPFEAGVLLASGPDGYLSRTCTDDGRCTGLLHERSTGQPRVVGLAPPSDATPGSLSPGNRFVTLSVLGEPAGTIEVRALDSPRVLRAFAEDGPVGGSAVWLSDHWVALAGASGRILLYDAATDEVVSPDLPLTSTVQQLVSRPA